MLILLGTGLARLYSQHPGGAMLYEQASTTIVEHFRNILVWPLQLVPFGNEQMARHWQKLGSPLAQGRG